LHQVETRKQVDVGFKRGMWRCAQVGCQDDAAVSVMVVVATPGKQRERTKKASKAVRLCMAEVKQLAFGVMPEALQRATHEVLQTVTAQTWDRPKPTRVK
jgi:hypothetical protein